MASDETDNDDTASSSAPAASSLEPIDKFGVVAAMARNSRIMGINGKLPWNIPQDRKHFVDLTRDKVLIMGRRTYQEQPTRSHICHAAHNIVVSSTMKPSDNSKVEIATSFPLALHLAKVRLEESGKSDGDLECWVVGGERIFNEALNHPSAKELHLTIVDMDVDFSKQTNKHLNTQVALFPPKYRWDRHFQEVERSSHDTTNEEGNPSLRYEHVLYKRKH